MLNLFKASSSLDEVVFANRNKAYGAYAIRKEYDTRVTKSLFIVLGSFLLLLLVALGLSKLNPPTQVSHYSNKDNIVIHEYDLETILPPQTSGSAVQAQPTSQPKASSSQTDNNNYQITTTTTTPPVTTTANTSTNQTDADGTNSGTLASGALTEGSGSLPGTTEELPMITFFPQVMPEFNEGNLYQYLAKNITYPENAIAAGIQGKVIVVFDVMPDGTIANVKVERGIGFGCDEEAMRVVRNMPMWKPGLQNGKAVPVRMRLPIKFETL